MDELRRISERSTKSKIELDQASKRRRHFKKKHSRHSTKIILVHRRSKHFTKRRRRRVPTQIVVGRFEIVHKQRHEVTGINQAVRDRKRQT